MQIATSSDYSYYIGWAIGWGTQLWRPTITNLPSTRTSWMRSLKCWMKDLERVMPSLGFRVYWGSELVFQECNLWNPFLTWVHDGFGVNKSGEVLALDLYGIKFFTEKIKRYIMYVKGRRVLFVILNRKSRRKSVLTLYAFDSLTGRKVHKTQMSLCMWLGCGFDRTLIEESWKNVAPPLGFRVYELGPFRWMSCWEMRIWC